MFASADVAGGQFRGAGILAYTVGAASLGAIAFGHEFSSGTMQSLLALPRSRRSTMALKLGVLVFPGAARARRSFRHVPGARRRAFGRIDLPLLAAARDGRGAGAVADAVVPERDGRHGVQPCDARLHVLRGAARVGRDARLHARTRRVSSYASPGLARCSFRRPACSSGGERSSGWKRSTAAPSSDGGAGDGQTRGRACRWTRGDFTRSGCWCVKSSSCSE